ncbi:MAG: 50S ribosomal protein L4 [Deltaproteobacteria bacterium]|nr:50S ribosomal protein L4 [Deltaproteobacteria bacterium]
MEALTWKVLNMQGKEVGTIDLDPEVFAAPLKKNLVHETVRWQLNKRRAGTHSAKTRTMKEGGKKKPWKQKGTGRARAGSSVSPLWVGGASIHGPLPHKYISRLPKRTRRQALAAVLSSKAKQKQLVVLDTLTIASGKTKDMVTMLEKIGVAGKKAALVLSQSDANVQRSGRNVKGLLHADVGGINVYDLMRHTFLISTKEAILGLQARVKGTEE